MGHLCSLNKNARPFRGESAARHTVPPGFTLHPSASSGHLLGAGNGARRFAYLVISDPNSVIRTDDCLLLTENCSAHRSRGVFAGDTWVETLSR
jgi:hypothetical protein